MKTIQKSVEILSDQNTEERQNRREEKKVKSGVRCYLIKLF